MKDQDDTDVQPQIDAAKEALAAPAHYLNKGLANVTEIARALAVALQFSG